MRLKDSNKLLEIWKYALNQGANVALMRHAPKAGGNESILSAEGERLAKEYRTVLNSVFDLDGNVEPVLLCTSKIRTGRTLQIIFPGIDPKTFVCKTDLDANRISEAVERQVVEIHKKVGHWRGFALNQTYHFLDKFGGKDEEEFLHTTTAERMSREIKDLLVSGKTAVYCGHSPQIEAAAEKILGVNVSEFGGFLRPLDSLHLKINGGRAELVARVNPIVDYEDAEADTFFGKKEESR